MTLLVSAVIAVVFGAGAFLMLKPDLFRVVAGVVLVSNAANLTLMASGLSRGRPPIAVAAATTERVSDPLVQAMTLTAIVIGFATVALLLALVHRIYTTHSTFDLDELTQAEVQREAELEREAVQV